MENNRIYNKNCISILYFLMFICIIGCAHTGDKKDFSDPSMTFQDETNSLEMKFIYIKPGTFTMGSPENEPGRDSDETLHQVTFAQGFYIQSTEVTQGQWKAVMGDNPSYVPGCGDTCPVDQVSWNDVQEFIRKLNQKEGKNYRLPTEAEWEYSARAGSTTPFYKDACLTTEQANYDGNYPLDGCQKGQLLSETLPVQSFEANEWGLYDMHGNVNEWCQDWYGNYSSDNVTDPTGPSSGSGRVLRGGSCFSHARFCGSANRINFDPARKTIDSGFRLVFLPGQ